MDDTIRNGIIDCGAMGREHIEDPRALEEGLRAVATGAAAHRSIDEGRLVSMSGVLPAGW